MFSMTNLLLETAKDNLAYKQNTFIMVLGTGNDRALKRLIGRRVVT